MNYRAMSATLAVGALAATALTAGRRRRQREPDALAGKVVVITGGSSGNGRATALECAARGASLVLAARSADELELVAAEVRALGGRVLLVPTDVRQRAEVEALVEATVAEYGKIDVMFNNAAAAFFADVTESPETEIENLIRTNVWGVIYGVQAAAAIMRDQGFGHIINMASAAGRVGFPRMGVYAGTKAFVEVLTQVLRQELMHLEHSGILVSAVSPVAVRTPYFDKAANLEEGSYGGYLTGPVLEADDVGRAVADAMVHYRPVVYPFRPAQGLAAMYDLFPGATDVAMSLFRPDRPVGPFTKRKRGSLKDERPITPTVEDGKLVRG